MSSNPESFIPPSQIGLFGQSSTIARQESNTEAILRELREGQREMLKAFQAALSERRGFNVTYNGDDEPVSAEPKVE